MIFWAMFDATHPKGHPTEHIESQVAEAQPQTLAPTPSAEATAARSSELQAARSRTTPNTPMRQNAATVDVNHAGLDADSAEYRNLWFEFNPDEAGSLPKLRIPGEEETAELQWSKPSKTPAARLRASPNQQKREMLQGGTVGVTPSRRMPPGGGGVTAPPGTPLNRDARSKQAASAEQRKAAEEQIQAAVVHRRMFSV